MGNAARITRPTGCLRQATRCGSSGIPLRRAHPAQPYQGIRCSTASKNCARNTVGTGAASSTYVTAVCRPPAITNCAWKRRAIIYALQRCQTGYVLAGALCLYPASAAGWLQHLVTGITPCERQPLRPSSVRGTAGRPVSPSSGCRCSATVWISSRRFRATVRHDQSRAARFFNLICSQARLSRLASATRCPLQRADLGFGIRHGALLLFRLRSPLRVVEHRSGIAVSSRPSPPVVVLIAAQAAGH